jgi:CDP-4-dehydro-6-deoxyglucose reductase
MRKNILRKKDKMPIDLSKRPRPQQCTAVIESKVSLTKNVWLVNFRMQTPSEITFLPGQTISLHVGDKLNRSMSIASVPEDKTHILMCHDVSPMGPGSLWTMNHKVGDTATFMAPLGIFILDKDSHRKKVLIATGTGIAPYRSMLLDYLEHGGSDDVTLYWGLRYEDDVYWIEEFERLAQQYANFRFVLILSRPTEAWKGKKGHVTEHMLENEANLPGSDFYLCGNKEMIRDVGEQLLGRGVPKEQIYKELYF